LDYISGGLKMVDPFTFAQAQKMVWVKYLLDDSFSSPWKLLELSVLKSFNSDINILWKAHAPENFLSLLKNTQIADSLRAWYFFREKAALDLGYEASELKLQGCIWYNKNVRTKSKQFFYYESWYKKGISTIVDLLYVDLPNPVLKSFDDLIIEYDIPYRDRRKYNSLMKCIVDKELLDDATSDDCEFFDIFSNNLIMAHKVPRYSYSILIDKSPPAKSQLFWKDLFKNYIDAEDLDWETIHIRNFKCTIETQLRSFYFKLFHRAIAFNNFLFKIGRKESPLCSLCNESPETFVHIFCECDKVKPIWEALLNLINAKLHADYLFNNFDLMFGVLDDSFLTYIFLCAKFYIYRSKFQQVLPTFSGLKSYLLAKRNIEYNIAKKKGKLANHFRKWRFDFV